MGSGHLFPLFTLSSRSRSSIFKSLVACHHKPNQMYCSSSRVRKGEDNHHHHIEGEERAPRTAEEFKRVAKEKLKKAEEKVKLAEQGVANQTVDKTFDAAEEADLGDSVKERYKKHEPSVDYRTRPQDD